LCHQRRLLPLHANAVVIDGRAAAFAGDSGAGKSTLAAHFQKAGHEVLCDDVCVVSLDSEGRPWAWPGIPRVKLWGDAATAVGHDLESLAPALDGRDKYLAPIDPQGEHRPVPLVGLYLLQRAQEGAVSEVSRLTGQSAVEAVMQHTYRPNFVRALGLQAQHFQLSASLAAATGVYTAPRAWGFDVFAAEAERIERHVRDARPTMC
jgi:hypothetical protein